MKHILKQKIISNGYIDFWVFWCGEQQDYGKLFVKGNGYNSYIEALVDINFIETGNNICKDCLKQLVRKLRILENEDFTILK